MTEAQTKLMEQIYPQEVIPDPPMPGYLYKTQSEERFRIIDENLRNRLRRQGYRAAMKDCQPLVDKLNWIVRRFEQGSDMGLTAQAMHDCAKDAVDHGKA